MHFIPNHKNSSLMEQSGDSFSDRYESDFQQIFKKAQAYRESIEFTKRSDNLTSAFVSEDSKKQYDLLRSEDLSETSLEYGSLKQTREMYGGHSTNHMGSIRLSNDYEEDFYEIYNKAREYRQLIEKSRSMHGGATEKKAKDPNKPKKPPSSTLLAYGKIAKAIKSHPAAAGLKWTDLIQVAKMIVDIGKNKTGTQKIPAEGTPQFNSLISICEGLAKDPTKYINEFKKTKK